MLKQSFRSYFVPTTDTEQICKNIATEKCLIKRKTFLTRSWTGVDSERIENEITRNKFAFRYDARITSGCSVSWLKIRTAAGWWHLTVSFVIISDQIPGRYLKIEQGCFMSCFLLSHDSRSCSRSVRSYVTSVLDIAVSYYLILYLHSSVFCHLLPRNFKKIRNGTIFLTRSWRIHPRSRKGQTCNLSEHHDNTGTFNIHVSCKLVYRMP